MKNVKRSNVDTKIQDFGFIKLLDNDVSIYNQLNQIVNKPPKSIIIIGIGGSWLGAQLLSEIAKTEINLNFLNTIQPQVINSRLQKLDASDTLVLIQSKSGKTLETITVYEIVKEWLATSLPEYASHMIFCSDQDTFLHSEAKKYKSLFFPLNKDVGGRYSILSCMGLVLAKILQIDIETLIKSGKTAISHLPQIELIIESITTKKLTKLVLFNYNYLLPTLNQWLTQLVAESLGKDKLEITPITAIGVQDQHSILQMFAQGTQDKYVITIPPIIDNQSDLQIPNHNFTLNQLLLAEYQGTLKDLSNIHPTLDINSIIDNDDNLAIYLGRIVVFFELLVALLGDRMNIDPFNQPGVENSKLIAKKILHLND
jgi:glucose-6-phosphate isomerase